MKKTIAILLVLVIAGVGLFAAEGILTLTTSVPIHDEIKLVLTADVAAFTWGSPSEIVDSALTAPLANTWTTATPKQTIASVFARSNRTAGFKVTANATALSMTDASGTYYIGYDIDTEGAATTIPASSTTTDLGEVMAIAAVNGQAFNDGSKAISVKPANNSFDYKVGDYSATVTFTVVTQ